MIRVVNNGDLWADSFIRSWTDLMEDQLHDLGQTPYWIRAWLEYYAKSRRELFVLVADAPRAIWPLVIHRRHGMRCLSWIGQTRGMPTDYMFGLEGGDSRSIPESLVRTLLDHNEWDVACLTIPPWHPHGPCLVESLATYRTDRIYWHVDVCAGAVDLNLHGNFEAWLGSLGNKTRSDIRKYLRKADQDEIHLDIYHGPQVAQKVDILFELSCQNWSLFQHETNRAFIREVCSQAAGRSELFLAVLTIGREPSASVLGYVSRNRCFLHPAGVTRAKTQGISPGTTLYALLFKEMIHQGVDWVDLSPGLEEYKFRLGGTWRPVHRVVFSRRRGRLYRFLIGEKAMQVAGSLAHRMVRSFVPCSIRGEA